MRASRSRHSSGETTNTPSPTLTNAFAGILLSNTLQVMRVERVREDGLGTMKSVGFVPRSIPMRSALSRSLTLGLASSCEPERKHDGSPRRASSARVWKGGRSMRQNFIEAVCPRAISMCIGYHGTCVNGRCKNCL